MELPNKNISFIEVCCEQYKTYMSRWLRLGKHRVITHPPKLYHLVTRIKSSSTIIACHDQHRPFLQQSRRSFFKKNMLDYKWKTWFGFFSYTTIHQFCFSKSITLLLSMSIWRVFFSSSNSSCFLCFRRKKKSKVRVVV